MARPIFLTRAWLFQPRSLLVFAISSLVIFFFFPLARLFVAGWRMVPDAPFLHDPWLRHVIFFTYFQALASACLSVAFGFWAALLFSEQQFFGRRLLWTLSTLCFSIPSLLGVLALVGMWGRQGWVSRLLQSVGEPEFSFYGWPAILLGHIFFNFPLTFKGVASVLISSDRDTEKAALALGASRTYCFFFLTFRKLFPALRAAFALSFLYSAGSFLVVLLLGGGPKFTTLEVAIYRATRLDFDLASAVRYASVQAFGGLILYFLFLRQRPQFLNVSFGNPGAPLYFPRRKSAKWIGLAIFWIALFGLVLGPLFSFLWQGINHFAFLDVHPLVEAAVTSLRLAGLTVFICVSWAAILAYANRNAARRRGSHWIQMAAGAPLSVSTVLLSLALSFAFPRGNELWRGSLLAISLVQSLIFLPVVYTQLRAGWEQIGDPVLQSAASLGAGPWQRLFYVELPMMRAFFRVATLLAASLSLGEVGSILMFNSDDRMTLPLWIFRLMGQYQFDQAFSAGLLLLLFIVVLERMSERGVKT